MKKLFLLTFLLISLISLSQRNDDAPPFSNEDIYIKMDLQSVFEMNQISNNTIRVANTETVVLHFCNSYFKLSPGVHQINIEIPDSCQIWISEINGDQLDLCQQKKIIKGALKTIDYFSSQIIRTEDLIEWSYCD